MASARAEARLFAQEGAKVVIADVLVQQGEAVAADISAGQRQASFVRTDVTSELDWKRLDRPARSLPMAVSTSS